MIDKLLEKKLKELVGESILIVMDDGIAFLGVLVDFDKNTIVLSKVYQGPTKEIIWKDISKSKEGKAIKVKEGADSSEKKYGFIDWTRITLDEVYLHVPHISRIWPWEIAKEKKGKEHEQAPVYFRRRSESSLEMPEVDIRIQ